MQSHRCSARKALLLRLHLLSYSDDMINRDQPLIEDLLRQKSPTEEHPQPLQIGDIQVSDEVVPISEEERAIVRYVSGWMLRILMKKYPNTDIFNRFVSIRVGGLYAVTTDFENVVETLLSKARQFLRLKISVLGMRSDLHSIIYEFLLPSIELENLLTGAFPNGCRLVVVTKLTAMFIGDCLRKQKRFGLFSTTTFKLTTTQVK